LGDPDTGMQGFIQRKLSFLGFFLNFLGFFKKKLHTKNSTPLSKNFLVRPSRDVARGGGDQNFKLKSFELFWGYIHVRILCKA